MGNVLLKRNVRFRFFIFYTIVRDDYFLTLKAMELSMNRLGVGFGLLCAAFHFVWLILVKVGVAKSMVDWFTEMHFVTPTYTITEFSYSGAFFLLVMAFVGGYIAGAVLAAVLNWARR